MNPFPWLSLLTWLPLLAGLGLLVRPIRSNRVLAAPSFIFSVFTSLISLMVVLKYAGGSETSQWEERMEWIPSLGIDYALGLDGLSVVMLTLSALIMPMALGACRLSGLTHERLAGCLLMIQGTLAGVFTAQNFFLWFFFYEIALIPAYFLIKLWGKPGSESVSLRFFIYSMIGSIALLVGYLALASALGSYEFKSLSEASATQWLPEALGKNLAWFNLPIKWIVAILFALIFGGLAVKVGMVPLHGWLPDTYEHAPSPVTMVLTALLSKMGLYGMVRMVMPLLPYTPWPLIQLTMIVTVVGLLYAAMSAMGQVSLKRMLAYSSVNHLGYCVMALLALARPSMGEASLLTAKEFALGGLAMQMFSHGLIAAALFYLTSLMEHRMPGKISVDGPGGLRAEAPHLAGWMGLAVFASIGLPGLCGFIGEFMIFRGVFALIPWAACIALPALLITAIFYLRMLQYVFHGQRMNGACSLTDLSRRECLLMMPVMALILILGWFPHYIMDLLNPTLIEAIEGMIF